MKFIVLFWISLSLGVMSIRHTEAKPLLPKIEPIALCASGHGNGINKKNRSERVQIDIGVPLFWNLKAIKKGGVVPHHTGTWFHQNKGYYIEGEVSFPLVQSKFTGSYTCFHIQSDPRHHLPKHHLPKHHLHRQTMKYESKTLALLEMSSITSGLKFGTFLGAKWVQMDEKPKELLSKMENRNYPYFKRRGPMVGVHLHWSFFDTISLVTKGSGALLIGKSPMQKTVFGTNSLLFTPHICFLIGLNGHVLVGHVSYMLGIDYRQESLKQLQGVRTLASPINNRTLMQQVMECIEDLTLYGWTIHAGIKF